MLCKCKQSSSIDGGGIRLVFFVVVYLFTLLFFFSLLFSSTSTLPYHKLVCLCNLLSFLLLLLLLLPFLLPLLFIAFNHSLTPFATFITIHHHLVGILTQRAFPLFSFPHLHTTFSIEHSPSLQARTYDKEEIAGSTTRSRCPAPLPSPFPFPSPLFPALLSHLPLLRLVFLTPVLKITHARTTLTIPIPFSVQPETQDTTTINQTNQQSQLFYPSN